MYSYTYDTSNNSVRAPHSVLCDELPEGTYLLLGYHPHEAGLTYKTIYDNGTKMVPIRNRSSGQTAKVEGHDGKVLRKGKWVNE